MSTPINTLTASGADETVKDTVKRSADERGTRRWIAWSKDDLAMFRDLVNAGYQKGVSQVEATHAEALAEAKREAFARCFRRFVSTAPNEAEKAALLAYPAPQPASPPTCERCGGVMAEHERPYSAHREVETCVANLHKTVQALATQVGAR